MHYETQSPKQREVTVSNYKLSIIQYPSGHWGFVGSVPRDLAIRHRDNRTLSDAEFTEYATASNPAMVQRRCNYIVPVFSERDEAVEFARDAGFDIGGAE